MPEQVGARNGVAKFASNSNGRHSPIVVVGHRGLGTRRLPDFVLSAAMRLQAFKFESLKYRGSPHLCWLLALHATMRDAPVKTVMTALRQTALTSTLFSRLRPNRPLLFSS